MTNIKISVKINLSAYANNDGGGYMNNSESKEMYLETILLLHRRGARVKATDVATELGFSRPSVSNAVKKMQADGYIYLNKANEIEFTEKGRERAESTYERHCVLTDLLKMVGAPSDIAEENACRMEHVVSDELFEVLKKFWSERKN